MKWTLLCLFGVSLFLSSCAMPGKFEVEITPTVEGVKYHVVTTKNYGNIMATGKKNIDGTIEFEIMAEKVDATSLAIQTLQTQAEALKSLSGIVKVTP